MNNDEINRRIAGIMEPMPSEPPTVYTVENESPGGAWWYDVMDETGWQPLDFCTDIAAAWRCVEWAGIHFKAIEYHPLAREFFVRFKSFETHAPTAPMAICIAFLAAFGGE
jgi:hypothetical protein